MILALFLPAAHAQFLQQGPKLVGSDKAGVSSQGSSVALSADGNTAAVGGYFDNTGTGAAWIYVRANGFWTQQGPKLVGTGALRASQGLAIALSADGNTVIVGGPVDGAPDTQTGAAWVFTRANNVWTQQGPKLTAPGIAQGRSVSLSADGNTALVGGPGSVSIFTRANSAWTLATTLPHGTGEVGESEQGWSAALSGDGNTAIVGGQSDSNNTGASWIYVRTNNGWVQQGAKLAANDALADSQQGISVALSADGNTAVVGGEEDGDGVGAAWIYTRANNVWTQQGPKLVGAGATGKANQGHAVAISADGNTIVLGARSDNRKIGAGWAFTRANGVWTQLGDKFIGDGYSGTPPTAGPSEGSSIALSGDGHTALLGGLDDQPDGAAWAFVSAPLHFRVTVPNPVFAGEPLSFRVTALNPDDSVATNYTGTVHITASDPAAVLPPDAPLTSGTAVFFATLKTASANAVINATDAANQIITGASVPITVKPGLTSRFASSALPPSAAAGETVSFVISAYDAFGNLAPANTSTIRFTSTDPDAILPPDSVITGVRTLAVIFRTTGNQTITAVDTSNSSITGTSSIIAVTSNSTPRNLALSKPTAQSSTLFGALSTAAVDGNTDGNYYDGSVTHTNNELSPWWQVDLGSSAMVNSVVIWNRTDCCGSRLSNYWVFVSNTPFTSTDTPATLQNRAGTFASFQTAAPSPSTPITVNAQGRYVRVQLDTNIANFLSLAEVQVMGVPGSSSTSLAQGKLATQSSTLPGYPSAAAGSAVDGNTDGNFFNGSVTHTNLETNPWWQVDLGANDTVDSVVIWNRTDCCGSRLGDYWVFVSNTPFGDTDTPATLQNRAGTVAVHLTAAPDPSTSIGIGGIAGFFGRYVRVQLSGPGYLSLAEVQVFGTPGAGDTNVAIGRPATQSSTLPGYPSAVASSAVDGNTNGNFFNGSVTHTNLETAPWWQVDLGNSPTVSSIAVWNRTDCCSTRLSGFWVFVSDTPFLPTDTPATLQGRAGTFAKQAATLLTLPTVVQVNAKGRYVRIQLDRTDYLSLAEVQVFGQ